MNVKDISILNRSTYKNDYSLIIEFNESIEIHEMVDHKITGAHHGRMLYKMAGAEAGV